MDNNRILAKFRQAEWMDTIKKARSRFEKEVLGERPSFNEVRKTIPNPFTITALEWAAMIVLIVLTVVTSFKVGAVAVPFAESMMRDLTQNTYITEGIQTAFTAATAFLFMLMATPSLIYFKLLDKDPEVMEQKEKTAAALKTYTLRFWKWSIRIPSLYIISLDYLSPRLPFFITYASAIWLLFVSSHGDGTIFEKYLPVFLEVGLAQLVGTIIWKRQQFTKVVWDALKERTDPYDHRKTHYETDPEFLKVLYQQMRADLLDLQRDHPEKGKKYKPNTGLETAPVHLVDEFIISEYHRNTGGLHFASRVQKRPDAIVNHEDPTNQAPGQQTAAAVPAKRVPPRNEGKWTVDTLEHDFRVRGLSPQADYSERDLQSDYEQGYDARAAFRLGANRYFHRYNKA